MSRATCTKKIVYLVSFTFLGLIVSTLVHAALEMPVLHLITTNYDVYGNSSIWQNWEVLHRYIGGALWVLGATAGFLAGRYYWRRVYGANPSHIE